MSATCCGWFLYYSMFGAVFWGGGYYSRCGLGLSHLGIVSPSFTALWGCFARGCGVAVTGCGLCLTVWPGSCFLGSCIAWGSVTAIVTMPGLKRHALCGCRLLGCIARDCQTKNASSHLVVKFSTVTPKAMLHGVVSPLSWLGLGLKSPCFADAIRGLVSDMS
jgi:hypothetical protein